MTALETPDDYVVLENEVSNLLWQWILWKKLFLDEQTVDTLNQCAPSAFATIQESLLDGIFIILFRLIADKNGKSLTIKSLVTQTTEPEVNKQLSESHQRLQHMVLDVVTHRHKRIAHLDESTAHCHKRKIPAKVLPQVTIRDIDLILSELQQFMNAVSRARDGSVNLNWEVVADGDGDDLLICLRDGLRYDHLRRLVDMGTSPLEIIQEIKTSSSAG